MYLGGLLAALVVLAEGLHAQAPRVEATLDTAAARVGDSIRLTLTLHHDATVRPEAPDLPQIFRDFSPRCAGWHQREVATGFELAQECELRLYELGLHEVPAVAVPFVTAAGDTLLRETQPLAIEVISARGEGEDQLRDIKPPVAISGGCRCGWSSQSDCWRWCFAHSAAFGSGVAAPVSQSLCPRPSR